MSHLSSSVVGSCADLVERRQEGTVAYLRKSDLVRGIRDRPQQQTTQYLKSQRQ